MAIAFVQIKDTFTAGSSATPSATFANSTVSGNFIVAMFMRGGQVAATGCTDNFSNTYTRVVPFLASHPSVEIWYAANITAGAAHKVTFACTAVINNAVIIYEFSGIATSSPSDGGAVGIAALGGSSTNPTLQSLTTTNANDLVVALANVSAGTTTAGPAGWTWESNFNSGYKIVSATGAVGGGNFTDSTSGSWTTAIFAFKAAVSALQPTLTAASTSSSVLNEEPILRETLFTGSSLSSASSTWEKSNRAFLVASSAGTSSVSERLILRANLLKF